MSDSYFDYSDGTGIKPNEVGKFHGMLLSHERREAREVKPGSDADPGYVMQPDGTFIRIMDYPRQRPFWEEERGDQPATHNRVGRKGKRHQEVVREQVRKTKPPERPVARNQRPIPPPPLMTPKPRISIMKLERFNRSEEMRRRQRQLEQKKQDRKIRTKQTRGEQPTMVLHFQPTKGCMAEPSKGPIPSKQPATGFLDEKQKTQIRQKLFPNAASIENEEEKDWKELCNSLGFSLLYGIMKPETRNKIRSACEKYKMPPSIREINGSQQLLERCVFFELWDKCRRNWPINRNPS